MKYWTFYGERWAAKTSHLSMLQEGAYLRLCTWCMLHERPLPANRSDVLRIARAKGTCQERATEVVLAQFFTLQADGYHQKTADEILQWWHSGGAARNANSDANTRARIAALRRRRAIYVTAMAEHGIKVPSDIGMNAIRELAAKNNVTLPDVTLPRASNGKSYVNCNGVTNKPVTDTVSPYGRNSVTAPSLSGSENGEDDDRRPGPLGRAIRAMEKAGLEGVYPAHPTLSLLLDAGATPRDFTFAAEEAKARGKGYGWCLAAMWGRMQDAAESAKNGGKPAPPNAPGRPLNGRTGDFSDVLATLVSPETKERLTARLNDPSVSDPWDFPDLSDP